GRPCKQVETSQSSSDSKAQNGAVNNAMSESSKTPVQSAGKKNKKKKKSNEEAKEENKAIGHTQTDSLAHSSVLSAGYGQLHRKTSEEWGGGVGQECVLVTKESLQFHHQWGTVLARGAGGDIPPNAWLTFDVKLLDVK
ncbi:hypothetical protein DY000_02005067, partial [Brassica cretica]